MEFFCGVQPIGLVPCDENDWTEKSRLKEGSIVKVTVTRPRNVKFHRKFFALLNLALNNMREGTQKRMNIWNVESMLAAVKIDLGYYEALRVNGRDVVNLKSISFASMSQDEFEKFYDRAVTDILTNYIPGADRNDLLREVEAFIS